MALTLHGGRTDCYPSVAGSSLQKDKTGNCSSRQPDYGRNRFCTADFSPDFARAAIGMVLVGAGLASTFPSYSALSAAGTLLCRERHSVWPLFIALIGQTLLNSLTGIISQGYSIVVYPYMMIASLLIMLLLFKRSLK